VAPPPASGPIYRCSVHERAQYFSALVPSDASTEWRPMRKTAAIMCRIVPACIIVCLAAVSGCTRTVTVVATASPSLGTTATSSSQSPLAALHWTAEPVVVSGSGDADVDMDAAACPSAGACIVAGQDDNGGLVGTITGNAWEPETAVSSDDFDNIELHAASCPLPGQCVAAGDYQDTQSDLEVGMAVTAASQGSWKVDKLPAPDGAGLASYIVIYGLDCPAAGYCVAVGNYGSGTERQTAMVEILSNGAWTAAEVPLPPDAVGADGVDQGILFSVSCLEPGSCVAVGRYHRADGLYRGLIDTLKNGTWSAAESPALSGGDQVELRGVDCPGIGSCIAVGGSSSGGVIETLANGTWRPTVATLPAGVASSDSAELYGIACPVAGGCAAVGAYYTNDASGNSVDHAIIVTLSNGKWSSAAAPLPSDATTSGNGADLWGVACTKAGDCVATGGYNGSATEPEKPFIETAVP
jgi:hypothetical protein